ncbi:dihydrofolate reductase family protein [Compostimonas suwonensis]|uniref:Dihydrofolate reductase n=1 Tax=Compostimonas suwonensis TaxID=1048394 RepID=A0A2M9BBM8_9MICO|nr:dihydrofolate reductase family protein [Compostimonas suwonensis]PJJ55343.1 dihydrofolate reductase [Compostimonas suwonensis]
MTTAHDSAPTPASAVTQYYVASSLDGFIADPHDNLDWLLQFGFDDFQEHYDRFLADVGALVMGAATYEFVLGEGPEAWTYGTMPVWVLTHRELPSVEGANIVFSAEPVETVHRDALAAAGGKNVWVMGGGDVAAQFADRGLLDEIWLSVMPIVLGAGKPLLPVASISRPLELVRTTSFDLGAIELVYRLGQRSGPEVLR